MPDITFPDDLATRLVEALGLPADTTDPETVVLATEEMATAPTPKPDEIAAAAGLDPAALDQLKHDAEQGRVLKAAAKRRDIADVVSKAVNRGAITPARRAMWVTAIEADPTMADTLASLADELVVPISEIGHGVDEPNEVVEPSAWFR